MPGQLFSQEDWGNLYLVLKPRVTQWVYTSAVPSWSRQREAIIEDIVQEALLKTVAYVRRAERGEARTVDSLEGISATVAYHCYVDACRRDLRTVPLLQSSEEQDLQEFSEFSSAVQDTDPSEEAVDNVHNELLFIQVAHWIATFPAKQRHALLIDLANRMYFDAHSPTQLQEAFSRVGIDLAKYRQSLPTGANERARHAAHLSLAYKRLAFMAYMHRFTLATDDSSNQTNRPASQASLENQAKGQPEVEQVATSVKGDREGTQQNADQTSEIAMRVALLLEPYRTSMYLHCVERCSYVEIAKRLHLPEGTVKSHISRGKKILIRLTEQRNNEKEPSLTPKLHIVQADGQASLAINIAQLSEPYQTSLYLHCVEGYSYTEIADRLNLPKGTVKSHISRGKKMLSYLIELVNQLKG